VKLDEFLMCVLVRNSK